MHDHRITTRLARLGWLLICSVLGACTMQPPQRPAVGTFVERAQTLGGLVYRYQVFVPSRKAGGRHPPVILFLHGTGERGSDAI